MDALEIWMIMGFTAYQTTTLPKWMFSQKHPSAAFKFVPLTFAISSDLFYMACTKS